MRNVDTEVDFLGNCRGTGNRDCQFLSFQEKVISFPRCLHTEICKVFSYKGCKKTLPRIDKFQVSRIKMFYNETYHIFGPD